IRIGEFNGLTTRFSLRGLIGLRFRHGLCVGSDAQAAELAKAAGYYITGHPPTNRKLVDPRAVYHRLVEPRPYLERNLNIVTNADVMIATPYQEFIEVSRGSGTWSTIRCAITLSRPLLIIAPSGR